MTLQTPLDSKACFEKNETQLWCYFPHTGRGTARSMTQTGKGPLLLPLSEKRAFLPSAGGKSVNLYNVKKEKYKRWALKMPAGEWVVVVGGGCLMARHVWVPSVSSVSVIRSIIHSSICHIAVSLTLKLPGGCLRDRSTSVVRNETAREMKQQDTSLPLPARSLGPLFVSLCGPSSSCTWDFFKDIWGIFFCNL